MKKQPTPAATLLEAATQAAYQAFARYDAPHGVLDVCTSCCMDAELEREMRRLPLHQLTEKHFYEYNDSAKSQVQPAREIKYLAPRLLELLAEGARLHHSTELYLDRLGRCEPGSFSATEQAALQGFALAYFAQGLEQWPAASDSLFQGDNAFSILLMWAYARVPLEPLLQHWLDCESDASTLNFVDACYWDYVECQPDGQCVCHRPGRIQTHHGGMAEQASGQSALDGKAHALGGCGPHQFLAASGGLGPSPVSAPGADQRSL